MIFFGGVEEDLPDFFFGKLGALIHFSTKSVLKSSSHLKHEIGWMGEIHGTSKSLPKKL